MNLFKGATSVRVGSQSIFEKHPDVALGDPRWSAKLMRKHMQNVADINGHANVEPITSITGT